MKKNSLTACSILLFACASLLGCKKESSAVNASQEDASTINSINSEDKSLCRLVLWHGLDDGYSRTLRYNDKGLLNFWHESSPLSGFDVHFIVAYEPDNKVSKIKYYDHDNFHTLLFRFIKVVV